MTEQLLKNMNDMKMDEEATSASLKMMNQTMNDILTKRYGMKEDHTYVVPLKPSRGTVRILELKRDRETDDIHQDIRRAQKILLKINEGIKTCQKTTYRYHTTKRRNREYETCDRQHKKKKKEEQMASRQRQTTLNTSSHISLNILINEMDNSEDGDEFDSDPDFS
jgi:hypothetical protein